MIHNKYTFPLHSFVDLITNSSTEIYIEASEKTIETLKELINNLLTMGGSKLTCDDLFTIEIDKHEFKDRYDEDYDVWNKADYHDGYYDVSLLVKCKNENSEVGKATAPVLSNLTDMFHMSSEYNG